MENNLRLKGKKNITPKEPEFINTLPIQEQISYILSSPWEKRHELIIASEKAAEIVASMPVEELFWTIKSTGIEDSGPILNLVTPEQLQFIFDLDWWHKAELRPEKIAAWLLILFELSVDALERWLKWILKKDPWLFPAVFNEFIQVVKRPDDMDIQEAKDTLPPFTLDNCYYIAFKKQKLAPLFANLITHILGISDGYYRDIFETMLWETPSSNLETAYRLRCGRIGDFGIPDYYDSLNIYVPIEIGQMHRIDLKNSPISKLPLNLELPAFVPTLYINDYPVLEPVFRKIAGNRFVERIIREITGVANKVLMVDMTDLDDPDQLKNALKKTFSLLNLGLEYLSKELNISPEEALLTHFVEEIVRLSSKILLPISSRARELKKDRAFALLPHHLKDMLEEASKRPPLFLKDERNPSPICSLSDLKKLKDIITLSEDWKRIAYFLSPPFETWQKEIDFKNTNLLAFEELSADIALSTAFCRLFLEAKFMFKPLQKDEIKRLKGKLDSIDIQNFIVKDTKELLEPMFKEISISEQGKAHVLKKIQDALKEIKGIHETTHDPRFFKEIAVNLS